MPPSGSLSETFRATGRPVQALLNTLIVKLACEPLTRPFPAWQSPGFTRRVAFVSPASRRVLQANLVLPGRQPLGGFRFSELRHAGSSLNSFNLNHLRAVVNPRFPQFGPARSCVPPFARQPYRITSLPRGVNPSAGSSAWPVFNWGSEDKPMLAPRQPPGSTRESGTEGVAETRSEGRR